MFPLASFLISLAGLLFSTYTDFRDRTIPNYITLGMLVLGMGLAAYESYLLSSWSPLLLTGAVVLATYILAYFFWRVGAWAGGDVKLFTGLAALNPFNPFFLGSFLGLSFTWNGIELIRASTLPLFMLNLFIFSVFMLIPYTALLALSTLHEKSRRKAFADRTLHAVKSALEYGLLIILFTHLLSLLVLPFVLLILLLLLVSLVPPLIRLLFALAGIALLLFSVVPLVPGISAVAVLLVLNIFLSWYGFAREFALTKTKKISQLEEADIPGELIVIRNGKVIREISPVSFKTIIKAGVDRDLTTLMSVFSPPQGDVLANPRQAAGFYSDQIARLQSEVKSGHLEDHIKIKASSPFAPAVLMAYILLSTLGDGPLMWGFG